MVDVSVTASGLGPMSGRPSSEFEFNSRLWQEVPEESRRMRLEWRFLSRHGNDARDTTGSSTVPWDLLQLFRSAFRCTSLIIHEYYRMYQLVACRRCVFQLPNSPMSLALPLPMALVALLVHQRPFKERGHDGGNGNSNECSDRPLEHLRPSALAPYLEEVFLRVIGTALNHHISPFPLPHPPFPPLPYPHFLSLTSQDFIVQYFSQPAPHLQLGPDPVQWVNLRVRDSDRMSCTTVHRMTAWANTVGRRTRTVPTGYDDNLVNQPVDRIPFSLVIDCRSMPCE